MMQFARLEPPTALSLIGATALNTYSKRINHRKIYEKYYNVKIGRDEFGRAHEIHHIDGNHENNDPLNLKEVTIEDHYRIHYKQGDWAACSLMTYRMNISPEERSDLARKNSYSQIDKGIHVFQNTDFRNRHSEIVSQYAIDRINSGTHNFQKEEVRLKNRKSVSKSNLNMIKNGNHPFQLCRKSVNDPSQVQWTCDKCNKIGKGKGNFTMHKSKFCKSLQ